MAQATRRYLANSVHLRDGEQRQRYLSAVRFAGAVTPDEALKSLTSDGA